MRKKIAKNNSASLSRAKIFFGTILVFLIGYFVLFLLFDLSFGGEVFLQKFLFWGVVFAGAVLGGIFTVKTTMVRRFLLGLYAFYGVWLALLLIVGSNLVAIAVASLVGVVIWLSLVGGLVYSLQVSKQVKTVLAVALLAFIAYAIFLVLAFRVCKPEECIPSFWESYRDGNTSIFELVSVIALVIQFLPLLLPFLMVGKLYF